MHYALVVLLIVVGLIALGPVTVASKEVLLFLLLASLVSLAAESWIVS